MRRIALAVSAAIVVGWAAIAVASPTHQPNGVAKIRLYPECQLKHVVKSADPCADKANVKIVATKANIWSGSCGWLGISAWNEASGHPETGVDLGMGGTNTPATELEYAVETTVYHNASTGKVSGEDNVYLLPYIRDSTYAARTRGWASGTGDVRWVLTGKVEDIHGRVCATAGSANTSLNVH